MTVYVNNFKENKKSKKNITMSFRVKQLFKKCNKIWKKIERLMSIDFESKAFYNDDDEKYKAKQK